MDMGCGLELDLFNHAPTSCEVGGYPWGFGQIKTKEKFVTHFAKKPVDQD